MKRPVLITGSLIAAGLIWAATVGAMYQAVRHFETTPGRGAAVRTMWPVRSRIVPDRNHWTLVMLIHPHCGCSRASIQELERIIEMSGPSLQTYVLVYGLLISRQAGRKPKRSKRRNTFNEHASSSIRTDARPGSSAASPRARHFSTTAKAGCASPAALPPSADMRA